MSNPCSKGANCVNTPGGYTCNCSAGFSKLSPQDECFDINECAKSNSCGINAKCINVPGSYKCLCLQGFKGQAEIFCDST